MTNVIFSLRNSVYQSVTIHGHADYADEGEDIVCSAITSAVQFLHLLLEDQWHIQTQTQVQPEDAFIRIALPPDLSALPLQSAQQAFQALRMHYEEMEANYAQFIHVTEVQNDAEN